MPKLDRPSPGRRPASTPGKPSVLAHLAVMAVVAAILGVLVAGLAIPFAGVLGVAAKDVSKGMVNLPDELEAKEEAAAAVNDTYAGKIRELRYAIAFEKNKMLHFIRLVTSHQRGRSSRRPGLTHFAT